MGKIEQQYQLWKENAIEDQDLVNDLNAMDEKKKEDAFYRDLEFGTAGLRGKLGAGSNRMNIYVVSKATQGLSDYLNEHYSNPTVAIAYDSRIKSDVFARRAAEVFSANGINVHIYKELMPVPCLSFAVRKLKCDAGVVITASHNPSIYNGYKVYGNDGCQITSEAADEILAKIERTDIFKGVKKADFETELKNGKITYIEGEVIDEFIRSIKAQSMLGRNEIIDKNVSIVYTPLNGAGLKPIIRVLQESGYNNITVVKEQEQPDGNFPTCPYPNPEIFEAMQLGMQYAEKYNADLLLATDPDSDRCGTAVRNHDGNYQLISGNEMGVLLIDYICSMRIKNNRMPKEPVVVKTIVTTDLAQRVAESYGVRVVNVLTGFKYIGEQIANLEKVGKEDSYLFGYEESYGYLSGSYVRDKDAVDAAYLICEMFCYYKQQGISLLDKLNEIYSKFGYFDNSTRSFTFEGSDGSAKIQSIMESLRLGTNDLAGKKVSEFLDYNNGIDGLPKSNVLKYILDGDGSIVVRPSGTEPKLKVYFILRKEKPDAREYEEEVLKQFKLI